MDTLSPIIKALNIPNIHYYKKSGVYPVNIDNLHVSGHSKDNMLNLVVFSCFDDEDKWPTDIPAVHSGVINVGLFHGMIQGAKLQNGQIVEECPYKLKQFLDKVDYLMLGDIHQMQYLDMDYRAAYCGSYPQQSFSETVSKGYLIWDIKSKFRGRNSHDVQFVELPTVCPFYTVEIPDQLTVPELDIKKKSRIRVFSRPLNFFEKKSIEDTIKSRYEPVELNFLDKPDTVKKEIVINSGEKIENLDSTETQENLIKEFLAPRNLTDAQLKKVFELNQKYSGRSNTEEDVKRNIQYKIKKMTFANTFSYGEDNVFDFSKYKGIVGIFGKNAVGKSSLVVDIPLYTIFNKISKKGVVKNDLIINENKSDCASEIEIQLGQDTHFIRRATHIFAKGGKKDGHPVFQGKTEVDYKVLKADGTEEDKNGIERNETDKTIREVFGTPEDFMATSVAPQWQLLGIIDAGGTDRQKLIGRYFDINIFEEKNKMAKEDWKEVKTLLKSFQDRNFDQEEELLKTKTKENEVQLEKIKADTKISNARISEIDEEIKKIDKDAAKKQNNTFVLRSERDKIKDKVVFIDKKIKETEKYSCIKNTDCCMLSDLDSNKKQKQDLISNYKILEEKVLQEELIHAKNESKIALDKLESEKRQLKYRTNTSVEEIAWLSKDNGEIEAGLKNVATARVAYEKIKQEFELYDYFLSATSKDGISKSIISENLQVVNAEIKKILSNGVNFEIELVSAEDGKAIEIFFKHEKSKPRRIELCSGMEKTVAGIAIRAALVNITSLPRSNVFILDEVFTALDPEYMDAVSKMVEYLKTLFDAVILITHIDAFKDLVDHIVEIERDEDGYSRVAG